MGESLSQNQMQLGEQIAHETWWVIILLPLPSARSSAPEELGAPWGAALEERCREQSGGWPGGRGVWEQAGKQSPCKKWGLGWLTQDEKPSALALVCSAWRSVGAAVRGPVPPRCSY